MNDNFDYLIDKISNADFSSEPFSHLYIDHFFSNEHFSKITSSIDIDIGDAHSDQELIDKMQASGWKIIKFPGCTTDIEKYIEWRHTRSDQRHHTATEGFGMAARLYEPRSEFIAALDQFMTSKPFYECIAEKLGISIDRCRFDGGIQKYLDGYEISPHPDVRRKAATFMVNINPSSKSENELHHTHYLKLKAERQYIKSFWEGNPQIDRCWLPWDWTETKSIQSRNNSIVIFAPSNNTLHGVKANYDHLRYQRTQLYGNLWYEDCPNLPHMEWENLDLLKNVDEPTANSKGSKAHKSYVGKRNI